MMEYTHCCNECGSKKYKVIREAGAITICIGQCPICKKIKPIIPASDWQFMEGDNSTWD